MGTVSGVDEKKFEDFVSLTDNCDYYDNMQLSLMTIFAVYGPFLLKIHLENYKWEEIP